MKAQLLAGGRTKREARDATLNTKRSRREKAAAEKARIGTVVRATRYSELTAMAIPAYAGTDKGAQAGRRDGLHHGAEGPHGVSRSSCSGSSSTAWAPGRTIQANDLSERRRLGLRQGVQGPCCPSQRHKKVAAEGPKQHAKQKKRKAREACSANGFEWYADEEFTIDRIIGKRKDGRVQDRQDEA